MKILAAIAVSFTSLFLALAVDALPPEASSSSHFPNAAPAAAVHVGEADNRPL
ncbi:hypothetical protein [Noviherbaspirillum aridicola]|uniref:Uncharacterized protein n=1 Tax=Noviherbaspirillum aridicola TaxID=2849687 RepID=A0ABQ4Q923_9BURK|nr:hypothetical protein [Noviherbaspirillum aridicola]GIZ53653.1 hypothetical protein NCCP691_36670 [Noviherbaspirillum aridicola]